MNSGNLQTANHYSGRLILVLIIVFVGLGIGWHFGKPWIKFHRDNLIFYNCQLKSDLIPVGSKYPGRINVLYVQVGDTVRAGDVIATLEISDLIARKSKVNSLITMAEANLAAEKIAIESALSAVNAKYRCTTTKSEIAARETSAIKQELKLIQKKYDRTTRLASRGSVSQAELDECLRELQNYQNKVRISENEERLAELERQTIELEIQQVEARSANLVVLEKRIVVAKTELEVIKEQEQASEIQAMTPGVVTSIVRGAGSSVGVGDPVLQIQSSAVWSEVWINESQLSSAEIGSKVKISLKAYPDSELSGTIVGLMPSQETLESSQLAPENPLLQLESRVCLKVELSSSELPLIPSLSGMAVIRRDDRVADREIRPRVVQSFQNQSSQSSTVHATPR